MLDETCDGRKQKRDALPEDLPEHTCPFGVRANEMLETAGFEVDDHILTSRGDVDAFEEEQGVDTTPQIVIDDKRIGGSDDLAYPLAVTQLAAAHL